MSRSRMASVPSKWLVRRLVLGVFDFHRFPSLEQRRAEVGCAPPAVGKRTFAEGRVERPDVEVLDAVAAVKVVERCPE
jgi:hypothetical protein